ncbi:MAG TPA: glycosyltransferase family 2 protein [Thermoanaerobaculia bacterium]|nr:glycosyltransferase family 2 protein [Thermoanaerobaculia bacterium]
MARPEATRTSWRDDLGELLLRVAATGLVPARLFLRSVPSPDELPGRTGPLHIEIVSHCWKYDHLLAYQLSSLVNHPPAGVTIRMTVFHSPEDRGTVALLDYFGNMTVPGVEWNWQALDRGHLFRRAIGRNRAALATEADWIWFTDCDVVFHDGCLDALGEALQGRRDRLVFPREERVTPLLSEDAPTLRATAGGLRLVEIDPAQFSVRTSSQAKGPLQITHGDVARACGYCNSLALYQKPANRWRKATEDRAFRWLLRTQGVPLEIPGVHRIRHAAKGRYRPEAATSRIRGLLRRLQSWLQELRHGGGGPDA